MGASRYTQGTTQVVSNKSSFELGGVMKKVAGVILSGALVGAALLFPGFAQSAVAATSSVIESFDDGNASWETVIGTASSSRITSGQTQGSGALRVAYTVSSPNSAELGRRTTPQTFGTASMTGFTVDLKGDGTYNTAYLRLRDATGEVFMYRLANLNETGWTTASVDLRDDPAHVSGGNGDGVLDTPLSLYRVLVVRNGSQPATGSFQIDNLRAVSEGWSLGEPSAPVIAPSSGQTTVLPVIAGGAGDFRLTLRDLSGKTRNLTGTSAAGATSSLTWDGRDGGGAAMAGSISGTLRYDLSPGNGLDTAAHTHRVPYFAGVSVRPATATVETVVGMNSFLTTLDDPVEADHQASLMENAYVGYTREEFDWNRIEPRNNYYDWAKFDQAVEITQARNVDLIGKLVYTARWASSAPAGTANADIPYYPPASMTEYEEYIRAVVGRYKDRVDVWEVWNEPNLALYWKPTPNAAAYTKLLKVAYTAIKDLDPSAKVILGGVAGFNEPYMAALAAAGAHNYYDALGIHTYVAGAPEAGITDTWLNAAQAYLARVSPGKEIWITEVGWSACGTTCTGGVTEAEQADYLARAYLYYVARGIRNVAWFSLMEFGTSGSRLDNFGIVERAGRQKPAYTALVNAGAALYQTVSGGVLSPTVDGTSTKVNDFATRSQFKTQMIGSGGSNSLTVSTSRHTGDGGLKLAYTFSGAATGIAIGMTQPISGTPSALSMWVHGDTSNAGVYLKFSDRTGERFEAKIGNAAVRDWSRAIFYLDGANSNYSHIGGNNDGVVDYPITVTAIHVFKPTTGVYSGNIFLDDLTAHYGTVTRGTVLAGRGANIQAVYRPSPATINLPVQDTTASRQTGNTLTPLTVTGGKVSVQVSSSPIYVVNGLGIDPASPSVGSPVTLKWQGADRSRITIQITNNTSGALIRTLAINQGFEASQQEFTWDGKNASGTFAPAGTYKARLAWLGPDGRTGVVTKIFTLQ